MLLAVLGPVAGTLLKREPSCHLRLRGLVGSIWLYGLWRGIWGSWLGVRLSECQRQHCLGLELIVLFRQKSLSKNHEKGASGGISPDTYIAFVIIECIA